MNLNLNLVVQDYWHQDIRTEWSWQFCYYGRCSCLDYAWKHRLQVKRIFRFSRLTPTFRFSSVVSALILSINKIQPWCIQWLPKRLKKECKVYLCAKNVKSRNLCWYAFYGVHDNASAIVPLFCDIGLCLKRFWHFGTDAISLRRLVLDSSVIERVCRCQ